MTVRAVEGKLPYTGGKAISIDENKVISLNLRDENNLIIYDSGDDEIYVDLQLPDGITPTDAFPVGVTTGRVVVADGWDKAGTIICAKTTSGDNIKLLYADDGTLWIDNGTGTFKQIYFKADVDALITTLTTYINTELAKKQNGVASATAPSNPSEGDLWYDTTSSSMKVWDGTAWQSVGTGGGADIEYVTQVEYDALPSSKLTDGKHYVIYTSDSPTPPSPWQPGANTVAYYPLDSTNTVNDLSGNGWDLTNNGATFGTYQGVDCGAFINDNNASCSISTLPLGNSDRTLLCWVYITQNSGAEGDIMGYGSNNSFEDSSLWYHNVGWLVFRGYSADALDTSAGSYMWDNWMLVVGVKDSTGEYLYVNGIQKASNSETWNTSSSVFYVGQGNISSSNSTLYISNAIVENRAWTAQEIQDYYNQTKANYGIS